MKKTVSIVKKMEEISQNPTQCVNETLNKTNFSHLYERNRKNHLKDAPKNEIDE